MDAAEMERVLSVHKVMDYASKDERLNRRASLCNLRSFIITTAWVFTWERPEGNGWERVAELVGIRPGSLWLVFDDDRPRYEPPTLRDPRTCEASVLKRGKPGICGKRGTTSFRVTNPDDGTWRIAAYCTRHDAEGNEVFRAEQVMHQSRIIPEPDVNTGGLLPCYFRWDWEACYTQADRSWKMPRLGVRADDWPAATAPKAPQLSLIRGNSQDMIPGRPEDAPQLALVRND